LWRLLPVKREISSPLSLNASGSVILESPAVPVTEGDSATLICRSKSPGMTEFYKNDVLINNGIEGSMTLLDVSVSDQGRYRCKVRRSGESPESWLTVRGEQRGYILLLEEQANHCQIKTSLFTLIKSETLNGKQTVWVCPLVAGLWLVKIKKSKHPGL
uniref:Ig-like domain-containing protein n=1 Tax=Nothobranchius furzeri TaxID=105023 RepID=A0A8C6K9K9_NOTFU